MEEQNISKLKKTGRRLRSTGALLVTVGGLGIFIVGPLGIVAVLVGIRFRKIEGLIRPVTVGEGNEMDHMMNVMEELSTITVIIQWTVGLLVVGGILVLMYLGSTMQMVR